MAAHNNDSELNSRTGSIVGRFSNKTGVRLTLFTVLGMWLSLGFCGCGQSSQTSTPPPPSQGGTSVTHTAKFVYIADMNDKPDGCNPGKIWMYTVDPSSGVLTPANPPFVALSPPRTQAIAADPFGRFVYVIQTGCSSIAPGANAVFPSAIAMFTVDATTGLLTPTTPATIPPGNSAFALMSAISVDPTGRFVYVTEGDEQSGENAILEYAITTPSGILTPIGSVPTGQNLNAVTVDPSGAFLYVTSLTQGVFMYTISPATGLLTPTSPPNVLASIQPTMTAVDPRSKFAYVANFDQTVSMYTIDSSTGVLKPNGAVFTGTTADNNRSITVHPSGRFAYVVNPGTISMFSIDGSTGILSSLGSLASATGTLVMDPSGKFAYSTTGLTFTIDRRTGVLSQTSSVAVGGTPVSIAIIGTPQ